MFSPPFPVLQPQTFSLLETSELARPASLIDRKASSRNRLVPLPLLFSRIILVGFFGVKEFRSSTNNSLQHPYCVGLRVMRLSLSVSGFRLLFPLSLVPSPAFFFFCRHVDLRQLAMPPSYFRLLASGSLPIFSPPHAPCSAETFRDSFPSLCFYWESSRSSFQLSGSNAPCPCRR